MKNKIKKISKMLLKENEIKEKEIVTECNGIRITKMYNEESIPIGMLNESEIRLLKSYFKNIDDYYYVEKIWIL